MNAPISLRELLGARRELHTPAKDVSVLYVLGDMLPWCIFNHRVSRNCVRSAAAVAVGVVGLAGLLKAVDVVGFSQLLTHWTIIPRSCVSVLAITIPMLEVGLATAWFAGLGRRVAVAGIIGVLVAFSIGAEWQYVGHKPVPCGCFGSSLADEASMGNLFVVLARNGAICAALVAYLLIVPKCRSASKCPRKCHHETPV